MPFPPEFFGAGGPNMAEAGVGIGGGPDAAFSHRVVRRAEKSTGEFKRIFDQLFQLALEHEPDVIICVDFSGFNHRFANAIKKLCPRARGDLPQLESKDCAIRLAAGLGVATWPRLSTGPGC